MTLFHRTPRAALAALVGCVLLGPLAASANADEHPTRNEGHTERLDVEYDLLSEDALISDDMEEQGGVTLAPGVTCSYESVQSAPNPAPSSPSFVLLYVHPSDTTPTSRFDVPRSCSDGRNLPSMIARSSRNLASFQASQNATLYYRTQNITYANNYGFGNYATRGVRRFKSPTSTATWNATKGYDSSNNTFPKLTKLRNELIAKGFNVSNTRYSVLLDAGEHAASCTATGCAVEGAGAAERAGAYGYISRYYIHTDGTRHYSRFGCSTAGDALFGHEHTHQAGAGHVTDSSKDLMYGYASGYNYRSGVLWDYNRNSYQSTVSASTYVVKSNLSGTQYTC